MLKRANKQQIEQFKIIIKGVNQMTPILVGYYTFNDFIVEISKGISIFNKGKYIYGVTVIKNNESKGNRAFMATSLARAKKYIVSNLT